MAEYNVGFAKELITAAKSIHLNSTSSIEKQRAVLYLSLLSCEISLKALLESAGFSVKQIISLSHNLSTLLEKVGSCKVKDKARWVPVTRIRAIVADQRFPDATVGRLLDAEKDGASKYPNNIRYGDLVRHFPSEAMLNTAIHVAAWVTQHIGQIRK